jgi:hypothetical protein
LVAHEVLSALVQVMSEEPWSVLRDKRVTSQAELVNLFN